MIPSSVPLAHHRCRYLLSRVLGGHRGPIRAVSQQWRHATGVVQRQTLSSPLLHLHCRYVHPTPMISGSAPMTTRRKSTTIDAPPTMEAFQADERPSTSSEGFAEDCPPYVAVSAIKDLFVKRRVIYIRRALRKYAGKNPRISYEDFVGICSEYGLTNAEAQRVADMLEGSLFLIQSKTLNGGKNKMLYLKPLVLIDELLRKVDPNCDLLAAEREKLERRIEEFDEMDRVHSSIMRRANRYARMHLIGILGILSAKYGFFFHLVYSDGDLALGWDIMEPVTYLYGIFFGNLAILYIAINGIDFEIPSYIKGVAERRGLYLCEKEGFDIERYRAVQAEIQELREQLNPPKSFVFTPPIDVSDLKQNEPIT